METLCINRMRTHGFWLDCEMGLMCLQVIKTGFTQAIFDTFTRKFQEEMTDLA